MVVACGAKRIISNWSIRLKTIYAIPQKKQNRMTVAAKEVLGRSNSKETVMPPEVK